VNAALSERKKDGALRAPSFYIDSRRSLSLYKLDCVPPSGSVSFRVLRVIALQVVALWLLSVHVFASRVSTYTHVGPKSHHVWIDTLMRFDVCSNLGDFRTKRTFSFWHTLCIAEMAIAHHMDRLPCNSRFGVKVQDLGFRVQGVGFRVQGSGFGFRVQGSGFRVQGSGLRVEG